MTNKNLEPMDEAYKLLDGQPDAEGVSDAAKGVAPKTLFKENEDDQEEMVERFRGDAKCKDINQAYAMLFEGLAFIAGNR